MATSLPRYLNIHMGDTQLDTALHTHPQAYSSDLHGLAMQLVTKPTSVFDLTPVISRHVKSSLPSMPRRHPSPSALSHRSRGPR